MGKRKGFGHLLGLAAVAGAAAAAVNYLYRYEKFSEAVNQDFSDVKDSAREVSESARRSYTTLKTNRTPEDLKAVARDLGYAAKNLAVDTGVLAMDASRDAYKTVREALDKKFTPGTGDKESRDLEDVEVEFYHEEMPEGVENSEEDKASPDTGHDSPKDQE